jgi:hypothetical protein
VKTSSETRLCNVDNSRTEENRWKTMIANTAETATATTPTNTLSKCSVPLVMDKARIQLSTLFGDVKATTELAKNAIVCVKR